MKVFLTSVLAFLGSQSNLGCCYLRSEPNQIEFKMQFF